MAGTTNTLLNEDGRPLINDLRTTLRRAERTMGELEGAIGDAGRAPGLLEPDPARSRPLMRDLRSTSNHCANYDRLSQQGVGG